MEAGKSGSGTSAVPPAPDNRRKLLRATLVGIAVVAALVAWLATRDSGDDSSESAAPETASARIVTPAELGDVAATSGYPVYWAGLKPGTELELTELSEGGTQVRYLPEGTEAGGGSVALTTIGSYPLPDPQESLDGFAARKGSEVLRAEDGRKVVTSSDNPTSVYFVSPDNSVQVEVYDPSPQRAMTMALSGKVRPAG